MQLIAWADILRVLKIPSDTRFEDCEVSVNHILNNLADLDRPVKGPIFNRDLLLFEVPHCVFLTVKQQSDVYNLMLKLTDEEKGITWMSVAGDIEELFEQHKSICLPEDMQLIELRFKSLKDLISSKTLTEGDMLTLVDVLGEP